MKLKQVFVTGASGFIGTHLCRALLAADVEIIALVHHSAPNIAGITTINGDVDDLSAVGEALARCDAVLHLAAFIPPNHDDSSYAEQCFRSNALLTLRLAELVLATGQMAFIYLSSGQAYAYATSPVEETAPFYPAARASYYLGSKLLGEIYVEHLRCTRGLQALSLRLGSVYGAGMPENSVVAHFMQAACTAGTLQVANGGCSSVDFVSVSDVVRVVLEAAQHGGAGVYNVASGVSSSIIDLARTVVEVFPDRRIDLKIQPMSAAAPVSFPALDISKARQEWNYRPRSLKDGLTEYRRAIEARS